MSEIILLYFFLCLILSVVVSNQYYDSYSFILYYLNPINLTVFEFRFLSILIFFSHQN